MVVKCNNSLSNENSSLISTEIIASVVMIASSYYETSQLVNERRINFLIDILAGLHSSLSKHLGMSPEEQILPSTRQLNAGLGRSTTPPLLSNSRHFNQEALPPGLQEVVLFLGKYFRSENCRKFSPANRRHRNWEPIHQSSMLRVTVDAIGQCV